MDCTKNCARLVRVCVAMAALALQPGVHGQESRARGRTFGKPARIVHESSSQTSSSLLNSNDGMSVIGAALESRIRGRSRLDCSHLVHLVYTRAGFPYSYESSSELYRGVDEFRLVTRPQPGDLVVWPGHVGIVVNPAQNTFFSALRTGIGVDFYSSSYWKERGAPRFYRYAKSAAEKGGAEKSAALKTWNNTSEAPNLARTALEIPENGQGAPALGAEPANVKRPLLLIINSAKPRPEEVAEALVQALNIEPEGLPDADVFKLAMPLVVFSRVEVRGVKIHGDLGKAQVRITSPASVEGGQTNLKKRQESQNWPLRRRDQNTWEVSLPQDTIYVSQDSAVRILTHRLELSAEAENSPANLRQKSELAQMLNTILAR